jgi:hypothetical protein
MTAPHSTDDIRRDLREITAAVHAAGEMRADALACEQQLFQALHAVHRAGLALDELTDALDAGARQEPDEDPPPTLTEREAFEALDELDHAVSELLSGGDRIHMARAVANAAREIRTFMAETTDA